MDINAPLKNINKYKLNFKTKPWITPALQKSISIKNNLLKKFITGKGSQIKERSHKECKDYRNIAFYNFSNKVKLTTTIIILKPTRPALKTHGKA